MNILLVDRNIATEGQIESFVQGNIGQVVEFDVFVASDYVKTQKSPPPYASISEDWYANLFKQLGSISPIDIPVDEELVRDLGKFYDQSNGLLIRNLSRAE